MLHKAGITPRREHLDTVTKERAGSLLSEELCGQWLRELGQEAKRFRFEVAPNPCVGAAVVSEDRVIGRGYHEVFGQEHAEIRALAAARASGVPAKDWDAMIVTLEPCSTRGKTPPCVEAVLASGIPRVIVGEVDPDPATGASD